MVVVFPLYVLAKDCGDILRIEAEERLSYFEAIDVENDEYEAWDATGRRLKLVAQGKCILAEPTDQIVPPEVLEQFSWRATTK
jgi:hypothetical protein